MVKYLSGERGCSVNTISAYRDSVSLFLVFMRDNFNIGADHVDFKDITQDRIVAFLEWLEITRKCGIATRNARLAALHSFFRFLLYKCPEHMNEWQRILAIRIKKVPRAAVVFLSTEGMKLLLAQPDTS
ncbi:site-specific integrase, partial [Pedobacter sp. CG_S7]|uniref:tyrosine-type recombinase/integrase n=1 Tax=Pedobacter sp. CG_S7 TaxID=3143930 RepID=UPI0033997F81